MKNLTLKCFTTAVLYSITTFAYGATNYFLAGNFPAPGSAGMNPIVSDWCVSNAVTKLDTASSIYLGGMLGINPDNAIAQVNAGTFPYTGTDLQKFAKASTSLSALQNLKNLDPNYRSAVLLANQALSTYTTYYNASKNAPYSQDNANACKTALDDFRYRSSNCTGPTGDKMNATQAVLKAALGV